MICISFCKSPFRRQLLNKGPLLYFSMVAQLYQLKPHVKRTRMLILSANEIKLGTLDSLNKGALLNCCHVRRIPFYIQFSCCPAYLMINLGLPASKWALAHESLSKFCKDSIISLRWADVNKFQSNIMLSDFKNVLCFFSSIFG